MSPTFIGYEPCTLHGVQWIRLRDPLRSGVC